MWKTLLSMFRRDNLAKGFLVLFLILTVWRLVLLVIEPNSEEVTKSVLFWAASYQIIAFIGGILGLSIAKSWGGVRSVIGRSAMAFSVGLLFQTFGQSVFSFYNLVLEVEIPYPSIADIGYFGSIIFYIYGVVQLAKASGTRISLHSYYNQAFAILFPVLILLASYFIFLRSYEFEWEFPLKISLDFGYPLGQAFYVSLALLTYLLSKKVLGGIMRYGILVILVALVIQYLADFNFLFQANNGTWINGGYGDYIYLLAYFVMVMGLLQLRSNYKMLTTETNDRSS